MFLFSTQRILRQIYLKVSYIGLILSIHAPFSYGFHIGRWTEQLKLVLKQLYQFYGIENIDEYIKHEEEDTDSESDSENGDQNHKKAAVPKDTYAELEETKRRKPNGDEENEDLPVDDTKEKVLKTA